MLIRTSSSFLLWALVACEGTIGAPGPDSLGPGPDGDDPSDVELVCDDDVELLPSDMLRLTRAQFVYAVEGLTGVTVEPEGFSDGRAGAFKANGIDDRVSRGQVVGYASGGGSCRREHGPERALRRV